MKKRTRTTSATQAARTTELTPQDLTRVIGGTGGTIISESVVALPRGIQGSGHI